MSRGRGVPAAASPPTGSPLQYSPALRRVTTGFGMGPGGATALSATGTPPPPLRHIGVPSSGSSSDGLHHPCCAFALAGSLPMCEPSTRLRHQFSIGVAPRGERSPCPGLPSIAGVQVCPRSLGRVSSGPLLAVHLPPINPVVSRGAYLFRVGNVVLGGDSRLDAFSGSPVRT